MGTNTPEYRAMIQSTSDLTNAVKSDIGALSSELLSQGLIANDNQSAAINPMIDVGQRASQLVSLVRTRVQLNPSNFHKFLRILLKNASLYQEILEILDNKYKALGGLKDTGISAALASLSEQDHGAAQQVTQSVSSGPSSSHPQPQAGSSSSAEQVTSASRSGHVNSIEQMSEQQFVDWLRDNGMSRSEDRDKVIGEGINAQSFPYLEENDVREVIGNLSVGGKSIFRKLWKEYRIASENEGTLDSHLDTELDKKVHHKISQFLKDVPAGDLKSLGGALGISHPKLLRMSEPELAEGVMAAWLRREDEVLMVGKPTLRILATHLKAIGQGGLAHAILSTNGSCILKQ